MQAAVSRLARRLLAPLTAVAALALCAPGAFAACAGQDVAPTDPAAPAATLCLLNQERTARGLDPLAASPTLDKAAVAYARDMVARGFFDHVSPGGGTMVDRMKAAGWAPAGAWTAGENIAWGTGRLATPAAIVDGWMHSPGHKANILNAAYGQVGIGIAAGAPQPGLDDAGTYVNDFASGAAKAASVTPRRATARCASKASVRAHVALVGHRRAAAVRRCGPARGR
jgi:uncharacterized protein YkwD